MKPGTCIYCGRAVEDVEEVPAFDDDEAWQRMAREHAPDCEWIMTRAHRMNDGEEDAD